MERDDLYAIPVEKEKYTYEELNAVAPSILGYTELDKSRLKARDGTNDGNYQKLLKLELGSAAKVEKTGP